MTTQAWYRDDKEDNLHEPHLTNPPHYLTPQQVFDKTGVRLMKVEKPDNEEEQSRIRTEGGYKHHDWLDVSRDVMPDYDERVKRFYTEHLHEDDEIRLVTVGACFFEMRDYQDKWIRLHLKKGDLIKLPAGIYHRMTLDSTDYVKMLRLYKETPKWKSITRPEGDKVPSRATYLRSIPSSEM